MNKNHGMNINFFCWILDTISAFKWQYHDSNISFNYQCNNILGFAEMHVMSDGVSGVWEVVLLNTSLFTSTNRFLCIPRLSPFIAVFFSPHTDVRFLPNFSQVWPSLSPGLVSTSYFQKFNFGSQGGALLWILPWDVCPPRVLCLGCLHFRL